MTDKEVSRFIFRLFMNTDTLLPLENEIKALFLLCKSDAEYAVMKHILQNLQLLSLNSYSRLLKEMALEIKSRISGDDKLAIVASAFDHTADGSQALLHKLKPRLAGVNNVEFFNSVPNYLKKIKDFPKFVLIDDFCGTGKTLRARLQVIQNDAKSKGIALFGQALILAGMERALSAMLADGIEVEFIYECKAGISDHFADAQAKVYIQAMIRIEQELQEIVNGVAVPSLGYGKAEALFAVVQDNAPNSNFPVLWWPKDSFSNDRKTLLTRYEQ